MSRPAESKPRVAGGGTLEGGLEGGDAGRLRAEDGGEQHRGDDHREDERGEQAERVSHDSLAFGLSQPMRMSTSRLMRITPITVNMTSAMITGMSPLVV